MEYVIVKSYDGKLVRIPIEKKEKYLKKQDKIKDYLDEGKTINEIKKLLGDNDD